MLQESPGAKALFAPDAPLANPAPLNLRRSEAARYLNAKFGFPCSKAWLAKLACVGGGPEYLLAGKFPIYPIESLDTWALARMSAPRRSTSDRGQR
jgi:hypothetical protein